MIALITPTGGRAIQFDLCQRYMKRMAYDGKVVWIIVDDCLPVTTDIVKDNFRANWTIIKTYPKPSWQPGMNTQGRNMEAGINTLLKNYKASEIEAVFIIEDDDFYRARYIDRMMAYWDGCTILGETKTIYYNPVHRIFALNANVTYASLFQTAFSMSVIETLRSCKDHKFIDGVFWKVTPGKKLFFENYLSVGIKGLPGRGGIGAGHKLTYMGMAKDFDMSFLKKIIGEQDAKIYEGYYRPDGSLQHKGIDRKRGKLL